MPTGRPVVGLARAPKEARGILRTLAERPAYWTPYGQNNFGQRYRTLVFCSVLVCISNLRSLTNRSPVVTSVLGC